MIKFTETTLKNAQVITLNPLSDLRGSFARLFCENFFKEYLEEKKIVQVNYSISKNAGTIRGMHFQYPPYSEIKIIKCVRGRINDVIVDLRKGSETFLQWFGLELSEKNDKMILIPEGFAHGFQTLEDNCELLYFHTSFYNPKAERGLRYNDPKLKINWELPQTSLSDRDNSFELINDNFRGIEI